MDSPPFSPEQFAKRSGMARIETDLKKWLLRISVADRVDFIKKLWPMNYRFALILVQSSQLPIKESENLLRHWLIADQHNAAEQLIKRLEPVLGERKFWKIVSQEQLSPAMRDFLSYHSHGRLKAQSRG